MATYPAALVSLAVYSVLDPLRLWETQANSKHGSSSNQARQATWQECTRHRSLWVDIVLLYHQHQNSSCCCCCCCLLLLLLFFSLFVQTAIMAAAATDSDKRLSGSVYPGGAWTALHPVLDPQAHPAGYLPMAFIFQISTKPYLKL